MGFQTRDGLVHYQSDLEEADNGKAVVFVHDFLNFLAELIALSWICFSRQLFDFLIRFWVAVVTNISCTVCLNSTVEEGIRITNRSCYHRIRCEGIVLFTGNGTDFNFLNSRFDSDFLELLLACFYSQRHFRQTGKGQQLNADFLTVFFTITIAVSILVASFIQEFLSFFYIKFMDTLL